MSALDSATDRTVLAVAGTIAKRPDDEIDGCRPYVITCAACGEYETPFADPLAAEINLAHHLITVHAPALMTHVDETGPAT